MALNKAFNQYQQSSITSASPEELTLLLYNGLIRFLMQAQKAIESKDVVKAHNDITRAQDILSEFMSTLNMDYEISKNLMLLYDFMYRRLIDANVQKDKEIVGEVLRFAVDLRDTWNQAMKIAKGQPMAPPEEMAGAVGRIEKEA